jgi:hypothetical protein
MDTTKISKQRTTEFEGNAAVESPSLLNLIKGNLTFGARHERQFINEGNFNHIQKLGKLVEYCNNNHLIGSLNKSIEASNSNKNVLLYLVEGEFTCKGDKSISTSFVEKEKIEADNSQLGRYKTVGEIALLSTSIANMQLTLACSMKYFSDMGESRIVVGKDYSDNDYFEIQPHSGNYHFFEGRIKATFEGLVILNGQNKNKLYGSPLVLVNDFSPNLII